jgi:hypothetical protein
MRVFILCFILTTLSFSSQIEYEKSINIVTDHTNNMIWQDDIEVTQYLETYTTAKVYCDTLILNGYIDWRVPTIKELQKIVDVKNTNALNKAFKYIKPQYYTTTTLFKNDEAVAWVIDFKFGKTIRDKKINQKYIRCVRDIK